MAVPGIKYDDGTGGFATNCFPVRGLIHEDDKDEGSGAWMVAHKAEQRRRFKAVLCAKPRTYSQIREERKKALREGVKMTAPPVALDEEEDRDEEKILDGFFLMKHCCVEDPSDLCSVNVSGQWLTDVKEEDFCLFDNVAYVNASENVLPLEPFQSFPIMRELEMSLNGLRNIKVKMGDFPHLETLDLSYNNLSPDDILPLGLLPRLRVLNLAGNLLKTLPPNITKPYVQPDTFEEIPRFQTLEILMLDNNNLSNVNVFASLAGLPRLCHLNLAKNGFFIIPQLMLVDGRHVTQDSDSMKKSIRKLRSGRTGRRSASPRKAKSTTPTVSGKKSILKNTPSLEGPTNTPLLKPSPSAGNAATGGAPVVERGGSAARSIKSATGSQGEPETQANSVKFKDDEGREDVEDGLEGEMADLLPTLKSGGALETDLKPLDDDLDFGELNLEQLDEKIEEETLQEAIAEQKANPEGMTNGSGGPLPPPFPELRTLDLSYNQIMDEESLLAVAVWPMLRELLIHDNPLTTQNSGDPPLLKRFLTERLGISITRKRPNGPTKPHIELKTKAERQVNTVIPPVPRCNVEELLALEAPAAKQPLPSGRSSASSRRSSRRQTPNPAPNTPGASTVGTPPGGRLDKTAPLPPISPRPPPGEPGAEPEDDAGSEAFFMTQVDDPGATSGGNERLVPKPPAERRVGEMEQKHFRRKSKKAPKPVPEQYKGYEELLDIPSDEDDGESVVAQDLSTNVKSLQYLLKHPLVFREKTAPLDQPQPPFRPLTKHEGKKSRPRKSRGMQVEEILTTMRERSTVLETNLADVINAPPKDKDAEFKLAPRLLSEIQSRYNIVRATSLREASDVVLNAKEIIDEAVGNVERLSAVASQTA